MTWSFEATDRPNTFTAPTGMRKGAYVLLMASFVTVVVRAGFKTYLK